MLHSESQHRQVTGENHKYASGFMTAHSEESVRSGRRAYTEYRGQSQLPIHESRALSSGGGHSDGSLNAETVRTVAAKFDLIINEWNEKDVVVVVEIFRRRRRKTFIVFHSVTIKHTSERVHHA